MGLRKKKNIHQEGSPVLHELNKGIETFIREAIKKPFYSVRWDCHHGRLDPVACWKIKGCSKKSCSAYQKPDMRCWLKAGTFSQVRSKCTFVKQVSTCHECDVFSSLPGGQIRRRHENIDILIFLLRDEAQKLRRLAIRDSLTRLYNRNYFNQVIEREAARSERNREPLSFIMIDMDHFKQINDKLGHLGGDGVLKQVALMIRSTVRKSDLVFRLGGDEFLILMLNADCKKSTRMTERLVAATDQWNLRNSRRYGCRMSFSMGCATYNAGHDVNAALRRADEQMYRNKKAGKKRTDCVSS